MEYEGKDKPHSVSGGVKAFPIEGRFHAVRERLAGGFTDADRAWRSQFLKDQILHNNEPVTPEWFYRERYNPIRRFYRWPLETLFKSPDPDKHLGRYMLKFYTGKGLLFLSSLFIGWYIVKYHSNDWTNVSGFETLASKKFTPIGTPGYGERKIMKPADYYDNTQGFKNSPI